MAYMPFCILFQSIINLYLVMIPWFLYRLGVGTWISLGFPTISKKGDVGRCEMQAECGSCSGWCSRCRGSWHEQDVARCCRKSSLKNCMKYGISTVWSLKVWLFAFLMVKLRLSYNFFCPKWFPGAFYIASVWGTWSECLWGRWSLIQLVNVRMRSVHTAWPFSAQKQRDVQRLSEWREFFAGCCTCWPSTLCFLASNVQIQRETRRIWMVNKQGSRHFNTSYHRISLVHQTSGWLNFQNVDHSGWQCSPLSCDPLPSKLPGPRATTPAMPSWQVLEDRAVARARGGGPLSAQSAVP